MLGRGRSPATQAAPVIGDTPPRAAIQPLQHSALVGVAIWRGAPGRQSAAR